MKGFAILTVFTWILATSRAQVIKFGRCPKTKTVTPFDLKAYEGRWFEIGKFFANFQRDLKCVTAEYSEISPGKIKVNNTGYSLSRPGAITTAIGDATVQGEGKLGVRFSSWTPRGNYWVLDTDYKSYSLVFSCTDILYLLNVQYLWILSRTPTLDPVKYRRLEKMIDKYGIDLSSIHPTPQDCYIKPA